MCSAWMIELENSSIDNQIFINIAVPSRTVQGLTWCLTPPFPGLLLFYLIHYQIVAISWRATWKISQKYICFEVKYFV
jgi:hypothetical protein